MQNCKTGCKNFYGGEIRHHKECIYYSESLSRILDELEEQTTWIKTSNTLPEQGVSILGYSPGEIEIVHLCSNSENMFWSGIESYWSLDHITHWIPLPKLPIE